MKKFVAVILIIMSIATVYGYISGTVEFSKLGAILISTFGMVFGGILLAVDNEQARQQQEK